MPGEGFCRLEAELDVVRHVDSLLYVFGSEAAGLRAEVKVDLVFP